MTSKWQEYKEKLGETRPWDILNPNTEYVEEAEATKRYDTCKACPEFIDLTKQCKQCGCVMPLKTKLSRATCPIGKW
jgi:Rieske Fe-S protein